MGFKPNLEAGVVKGFFLGEIIEENIFPYPELSKAESESLGLVLESIERFMSPEEERFREFDKKGEQPEEYIQSLRELGLFGVIIPEEYEGLGLSNASYSRVLQQTTRFDGSTSLTIGAHSSIGMKGLLLFGTPEQKKKYLPKLASGELIAAFCLTEPGSGSDAASIKTSATKNDDGTWTLNGEKIWITNGSLAGFFTVFAKTGTEKGKLTAFIVERTFPGLSTGPKEDKMGIRASATTTVRFDNVKIPAANMLGEEGMGFKVAMGILNNGRTGLGGGCVGGMKRAIQLASKYALERKQFGRSISEFELVKEKIAQMTVNCFAAESTVNMVAHYIDQGVADYSVEAAISKVTSSEYLWQTGNEALQIAGGNGFMKEYPYERIVRDSRINMIFEGTNEILRLYIALSGMKDAGEYLKEIGKSGAKVFSDPIKGFGVFSGYATKRFSQMTGIGRDRIKNAHPLVAAETKIYELFVQRLSKATDAVLRMLGKEIIGNQLMTKRLADVSCDLFVGLCMLSRVSALLKTAKPQEQKALANIMRIYTQQAKRRMNQNLRRLESNEDPELKELSTYILNSGGYTWDII